MTSKSALTLFALAAIAIIVAISGCKQAQGGHGTLISGYDDLKPDQLGLTTSTLDLAGMKIEVDLVRKEEKGNVEIDLMAHGEPFEIERYWSDDKVFSVVEMAGERYDPPITLIKYGMRVGDTWDWTGVIHTGPITHKATAKVVSSSENLAIGGQIDHDVVRLDVDVAIDSGIPNQPTKRRLQFWLAKNKGVVQRKVGDYSVRMPSGD